MPAGSDFLAIAAGSGQSIALRQDGTLAGWGRNDYGQADVPAGNRFVAIACGGIHSLAIEVPEPSVFVGLLSLAFGGLVFSLRGIARRYRRR